MFPGGRYNPKQVNRMMKKMGMNMEEVAGVKEVLIITESKEIRLLSPSVTIMNVQGQKSYQVQADKEEERVLKVDIPEEDVKLVASQTGVSEQEARSALEETGGEPAEAIIKLMGG